MLAQALMQQRTQEQAAALRRQEAELTTQSVAPGAALVRGNKVIYTNPKDSPVREIKTIDANTGMPVTKYVPENVLLSMGAIPDQYKGFAADLIMAKNLPAQIMNDPQLLNLVGSQLNKAAGLVTQEDVANYMLKVAETRAKLGYEGIPFNEPKPLTAATNPLVKQTLPKGVPLGAVPTGKFTPEGKPVYKAPDGFEMEEHRWRRPVDALQEYATSNMLLSPPTFYFLADLAAQLAAGLPLHDWADAQPRHPVLPRLELTGSPRLLLPGDADYPSEQPVSGPTRMILVDGRWQRQTVRHAD